MPHVGYVALVLTFALAVYAAVVAVVGAKRRIPELVLSARNAAFGATALLTIAVIIIEYLLITGHYQTQYVSEVSNRAAPLFYRMTALWGGQDGSLLFWSWLMSIFAALVLVRKWGSISIRGPLLLEFPGVDSCGIGLGFRYGRTVPLLRWHPDGQCGKRNLGR